MNSSGVPHADPAAAPQVPGELPVLCRLAAGLAWGMYHGHSCPPVLLPAGAASSRHYCCAAGA